jgi:hypothetical protein
MVSVPFFCHKKFQGEISKTPDLALEMAKIIDFPHVLPFFEILDPPLLLNGKCDHVSGECTGN